jgi:hypothetical protein
MQNVKMSTVLFARTSPILIAGDDNGGVKVFRLHGLDVPEFSNKEQMQNLYEVMNPEEEIGGGTVQVK